MTSVAACLALVLGAFGADAPQKELVVGDAAPPLVVSEFVKGAPIKQYEKGRVYVVEFWATWCGPCLQSIPHLTELQKKNPGVTVVGVGVPEEDVAEVRAFVKRMGDKMGYTVALDQPVDAAEGVGKMTQAWLEASYQDGIPAAFIVNGEGKLAWTGHPLEMDDPLAEILAGKWDLASAAKAHKDEIAVKRISAQLNEKIELALEKKDFAALVAAIDAGVKAAPAVEGEFGFYKLLGLKAQPAQSEAAASYGEQLIAGALKDDWQALYMITMGVINTPAEFSAGGSPLKTSPQLLAVALKAAQRAEAITKEEGDQIEQAAVGDLVAQALFASQKPAEAAAKLRQVLAVAPEESDLDLDEMRKRLKKYEAAAKR